MEPGSSAGPANDCSASAGFNATGLAKLGETFGWQGGIFSGGTRTLNGDGSVTWSATHSGANFKGAIGSLSIARGVQNTKCPFSMPMFTFSGGTQTGSYNIPTSVTYVSGVITDLIIIRDPQPPRHPRRHHERERAALEQHVHPGRGHQREHADLDLRGRRVRRRNLDHHCHGRTVRHR